MLAGVLSLQLADTLRVLGSWYRRNPDYQVLPEHFWKIVQHPPYLFSCHAAEQFSYLVGGHAVKVLEDGPKGQPGVFNTQAPLTLPWMRYTMGQSSQVSRAFIS